MEVKLLNSNCTFNMRMRMIIIQKEIFELKIENAFLKTGTTNDNKERFAVLGNADLVYAVLRNENDLNDTSKEGSFIHQISRNVSSMFKPNINFVWI